MKKQLHPLFQWLLVAAFVVWSCALMVVIFGEDTPDMPLSIAEFFLIKMMGIASAYSTYKAGEWCYNREYFPALICKYIETCNEEGEEL